MVDAPAALATSPFTGKEVLLSMRGLRAGFATDDGFVRAVDGVSFDVARGEVLAIVGESGSGKSVTAMAILDLQPTLEIAEGEILWKGRDLLAMSENARRAVRGKEIAMIFQDPLTALNPVHTVGRQIGEMARIHEGLDRQQARARAVEMLDLVGIPEARKRADMYPHEFSGGMRQRAMIAMAISCKPDLLIADEPTTALDVTVQAQVLEVLLDIKDEIDSAIILITHDLGVVAGLADRVMVMYAGRAIETGTTHEIFYETRHPYTLGLLASLPRLDDVGDEPLVPIVGSPPSLIRKPSGCSFHPRCRFARVPGNCETDDPALRLVAGDAHQAACHYAEELAGVTVESLRTAVDVTEPERDVGLPFDRAVVEDGAVVEDVAVAEAAAHPGVTDRAEGQVDQWPATGQGPDDGEGNR
ncbi:MAG TPA: ABC transporter ATP-binding protein [Acidimicrobiales bacterium]|nr:ABC transporter ATP-binding protein [Acidimicrobiales bacterium]